MTLSQAGAVLFVLAMLAGLRWALRRGTAQGFVLPRFAGRRRDEAPLRLIARLPLTPTHAVHEFETARGERYLLATYPGGVAVVSAGHVPRAVRGQSA